MVFLVFSFGETLQLLCTETFEREFSQPSKGKRVSQIALLSFELSHY